jgi:hypothetical protein
MGDVATLVSGIEYKLRKLIRKQQALLAERTGHLEEIRVLKVKQDELTLKIKQLEEKINILKLAKTLETKEGNVEAKMKINELVREIEKCIGLLNT